MPTETHMDFMNVGYWGDDMQDLRQWVALFLQSCRGVLTLGFMLAKSFTGFEKLMCCFS